MSDTDSHTTDTHNHGDTHWWVILIDWVIVKINDTELIVILSDSDTDSELWISDSDRNWLICLYFIESIIKF